MARKVSPDDVGKAIVRLILGSDGAHPRTRGGFRRTNPVKSGIGRNSKRHGRHSDGGRGRQLTARGVTRITTDPAPVALMEASSPHMMGLGPLTVSAGDALALPHGYVIMAINGVATWVDPVTMGMPAQYLDFDVSGTLYDLTDEDGNTLRA